MHLYNLKQELSIILLISTKMLKQTDKWLILVITQHRQKAAIMDLTFFIFLLTKQLQKITVRHPSVDC